MPVNAIPFVLNLSGAPTNPGQATGFQLVGPWGQTLSYAVLEEAIYAMFFRNSRWSGKMGNYFNFGTLLGANFGTPTQQTGTLTVSTNTITSLSGSTAGLTVGQQITASIAGLALGTWITAISPTVVTMNNNFTGTTGAATITFFPVAIVSASDIIGNP